VLVGNEYQARYQRQPDAQSPAGGVSSSADDMARWMAMVLQDGSYAGQHVVASDALLPAITAQIISGPSAAPDARPGMYGYGFGVGILPSARTSLTHSGAFALGAATTYVLIPSLGIGITVLSNAAPVGAVEGLAMEFADLVQFGVVTRDWLAAYGHLMAPLSAPFGSLVGKPPPEHPAAALPLQAYTGVYSNAYFGEASVTQRGDGLVLRLGPDRQEHTLRHWDGNVFTYEPFSEDANAGSISKIAFSSKARTRAEALTIELYHDSGWDRFTRHQP
jgi:hypothetical protein